MNRSTCTFPPGNHTGFDNPSRVAVLARYGLVTLSWQTRICVNAQVSSDPDTPCAHAQAECGLDAQARRIKQINPHTRVLVYRNTELGMSSFAQQCAKMYDSRYRGYWLRDAQDGRPYNEPAHQNQFGTCLSSQNRTGVGLRQDQYFRDFRNKSSAADFVENIVPAPLKKTVYLANHLQSFDQDGEGLVRRSRSAPWRAAQMSMVCGLTTRVAAVSSMAT